MKVEQLAEVFVASGVNKVDDITFTALFHGYEVRGKVIMPSVPRVNFTFFGNIDLDDIEDFEKFRADLCAEYGKHIVKMGDKFISIVVDIGFLEIAQTKEILGKVSGFMMSHGYGAIGLQPEPEPEPEPVPVQQPIQIQQQRQPMQVQRQPQRQPVQQQQQMQQRQPAQQRPPEPVVPFEEHECLARLTQIFLLGVNQVSQNMFTTLYHGYNVLGKMCSPVDPVIEVIFYGDLTQNVEGEFEKFKLDLSEKYGNVPIRMVGGSIDALLDFRGKDIGQSKEMLGMISGFMMRNSIIAVNFPNTVGKTIKTFTQDDFQQDQRRSSVSVSSYNAPSQIGRSSTYSNRTAPSPTNSDYSTPEGEQNNFVGKFLKKFGKKP